MKLSGKGVRSNLYVVTLGGHQYSGTLCYYSHVDESGVECVLLALLGAGRALIPLEFDLLAALAATVTVTVHFYCACRPRTSLEMMHMKS